MVIHGLSINNSRMRFDGSPVNNLIGAGGGNTHYFVNTAYVQETVLDTGGISAESESGGANLNIVPKDGGNRVSVYFLGNYTGEKLQGDNFSDALRARGVTEVPPIHWIGDAGGGLGGPIQQDKLWFYTAHRWWGFNDGLPGNYFNKTQNTLFYEPDYSRPAKANETQRDHTIHVTWQAARKHKVNLTYSIQENCRCYFGSGNNRAPEAYEPDCDLKSSLTNGECGPMANRNFGRSVITTRYAEDVLTGWGNRPYIWSGSAAVQQELRPGIGLTVGYHRTSLGNFRVTDNLLVTPADYDPFCVTAPVDSRLPGGGGQPICGLYDLKREKFGQVDNLVRQASEFGKQLQVYNGVDIGINARFGRGGLLAGGVNTGGTVTDNCPVVDSPQAGSTTPNWQFCRTTTPWGSQTQVKLSGSYPLPWDASVSAVFQNVPGFPLLATRTFTNAEVAPSLGRNLGACPTATGACTATVSVAMLEPNTGFEDRFTNLDLRLAKNVRVGGIRLKGMLDIYNLFNVGTILLVNNNYGPTWLLPAEVVPARFFKLGVQLDF